MKPALRPRTHGFSTARVYCGNATADKMPIINTTTNNSINVKPLFIKISSWYSVEIIALPFYTEKKL